MKVYLTPAAPPLSDWGAKISSLMQQVNQLQEERDSFAQMLTQQRVARGEEMPAKKFRLEDFVPSCVEELVEWMGCRQHEINDTVASGRDPDVTRLVGALAEGAMQLQQWTQPPFVVTNMVH